MEELVRILKEIFPNSTPTPISGIAYGIILRQPNGYYKIYDKGLTYEIQFWTYDTQQATHVQEIPKNFIGDYFRQLTGES